MSLFRCPRSPAVVPLLAALALACRPGITPEAEHRATLVDPVGHRWVLDVPAGRYVYGVVDPDEGFDLAVTVRGPRGDVVGGPIDLEGEDAAERFHLVADVDSRYTVEVRGFLGRGDRGAYGIRLGAFRPATAEDRHRAEGHAAFLHSTRLASCETKRPWLERSDALYSTLDDDPDDAFTHATILLGLGNCQARDFGELGAAVETLEHALALAIRSRDREGIEPFVLSGLGVAERRAGLLQRAEEHLLRAIEGFRTLGYDNDRLTNMLTLATVYTDLGAWEANRRLQRQILAEARELGFQVRIAEAIANQGWTLMRQGRAREAKAHFDEAMTLLPAGEINLRATLLINQGFAALQLRDLERAGQYFDRCLDSTDDLTHDAWARIGRVYVAIARRDGRAAEDLAGAAVDAAQTLGRPTLRARALDARARARALRDTPDALRVALGDAETALGLIESTRPDALDDRAAYLDRYWNLVETPIALGVRLYELAPSAETLSRAFDNAERVRFRTLVEQLAEPLPTAEQLAGRASIETVRDELLTEDTALLQFHLGDRGSFLFRVTADTADIFRLPPREAIEARVATVRDVVTTRSRAASRRDVLEADRAYPEVAGELSRVLLGEALDGLDTTRLLIAADGDLHALPFAALPTPASIADWRPLLLDHEIVHVPSASVMISLRARLRHRTAAPPRDLVAFADPVFGPPDARLPASTRVETELPRLPHTAAEARAILGLSGPESRSFTGFEATRDLVLRGGLEGFRIAHFATHGRIGRGPGQSALVLSRADADGRPIDGDLTLGDLSSLDLDAELVVLSACETAVGHELRGEGLLGLARGFMNAGVPRVVASLWKVDDRATRDLMVELYARLLRGEQRPAAALRAAQRTMHERGEAVYHWAPFILQGEWL